jgi:hypothetical protein
MSTPPPYQRHHLHCPRCMLDFRGHVERGCNDEFDIRYTPEEGTDHTPQGPVMFRGVHATLLSDPGDEDVPGWRRKWLASQVRGHLAEVLAPWFHKASQDGAVVTMGPMDWEAFEKDIAEKMGRRP